MCFIHYLINHIRCLKKVIRASRITVPESFLRDSSLKKNMKGVRSVIYNS